MPDAADGFVRYYTEKLWELIPPYYRDLDGELSPPGALRAFVEVLAGQAAILRRSQDRLWEDQFVERADDWAVPYIGDLVATRLVSALLPRERRIDVAKTVYYRRRAGTLRVLEELISDIARADGVVREGFRRLARAPHGLDPELTRAPAAHRARYSGTPAGGLADLRHPLGAELAGSAFDEYHHTPDLRRPRGRDGQYGIPRLVFHLYRLASYRVEGVTPRALVSATGDPFFSFDPSGRDIALFARRTRSHDLSAGITTASPVFGVAVTQSAWEEWTSARPWEIPAPIRCRLLGDVAYDLDPNRLATLFGALTAAERAALASLYGLRVRGETRLSALLATTAPPLSTVLADVRTATLAADCGKAVLFGATNGSLRILPDGVAALPVDSLQSDELSSASVVWASWQQAAIDAERGRFVLEPAVLATDLLTDYHYGSPGALGAGVYERSALPWVDAAWLPSLPAALLVNGGGPLVALGMPTGTLEITDNRTYTGAADNTNIEAVAVRSSDGRRPYVVLEADWEFTADAAGNAVLALDGLWLGADGTARDVVLSGDWERVEIRACTLDPGGTAADGSPLAPVGIRIEGSVERLVIQSSIVSAVVVAPAGVLVRLDVNDSVLDGAAPVALSSGELHLERSTVLGDVSAFRLWASDTLFSGVVTVIDVQNGCFRFSAAHQDSQEHVPHPYQSAFFADASALFASTRFGDPAYVMLSNAPPVALLASGDDSDGQVGIHDGAENDGEMGAWNALLLPIKHRALEAKVEEFAPFGLLPVFVHET